MPTFFNHKILAATDIYVLQDQMNTLGALGYAALTPVTELLAPDTSGNTMIQLMIKSTIVP